MTEYENEPFIVGDFNHNQVEFMHLSHEKWYSAGPMLDQLGVRRIFGYAAVSRPGKVFLFGGYLYMEEDPTPMDGEIFLYQNHIWEPLGTLKQSRMNFMTITYGTDVMIFGGKTYENDFGENEVSDRSGAIELFSMINKTESDRHSELTDLTNMILPNAMFFNGISIILDDISTCNETEIGMNIIKYQLRVIKYN